MRLLKKVVSWSVLTVVLLTSFSSLAIGQKTIKSSDKCNCACPKTKKLVRKHKKQIAKHRKAKKATTAVKPVAPIAQPTPVTPAQTTVASADFTDVMVKAGTEGVSTGTVTLPDEKIPEDFAKVLTIEASSNLQAWLASNELHVFSPNGGNGRVLIKDKTGKVLDVIKVTSEEVAMTTFEQKMISTTETISKNTTTAAKNSEMLILLGAIIILLLIISLIVGFFQRRGLRAAMNDGFTRIDDHVVMLDERFVNLNGRLLETNELMQNIDANIIDYMNLGGANPNVRTPRQNPAS